MHKHNEKLFWNKFLLFEYAMNRASKAWQIHFAHLVLAGFIGMFLMLFIVGSDGRKTGFNIFFIIIYANLLMLCGYGVFSYATMITEEKEAHVLELLVLSGMGPFSILINKLLSHFLLGVLLVCVQIPFSLLAITLGGVTVFKILSSYIVLICFLYALVGTGTLISLFSLSSRVATNIMLLTVVAVAFIPTLSPFVLIVRILSTRTNVSFFPLELWGYIALGSVAFLLSLLSFNKVCLRHIQSHSQILNTAMVRRKPLPTRPNRMNLYFWREFNYTISGRRGLIKRTILHTVLGGLVMFLYSADKNSCAAVFFISLLFGFCEYLFTVVRTFSQEVRDMTLISVVLLPKSRNLEQFVSAKVRASLLLFLPGVLIQQIAIFLSSNYMLEYVYLGLALLLLSVTQPTIFAIITFRKYAFVAIAIFFVFMIFSGCLGILFAICGILCYFYMYHLVIARLKKIATES